uniref:NADH dehydrogenase subunit 2 n=1 Tax=Symplanella nigricans TaxID=2886253 RepID=UPI001E7CCAEB|nr:NADH dehydrogenase subunit 2 [Symplanella nigricans]UDL71980.1 NADH dehydrogenase subunit 2 [Symplanella nigricans]
MLMNSTKLMFMMFLTLSTVMVYSSSSFIMSWLSMEINLISFLPIITKSKKMKDQSMKYFIIQSLSSSMMLLSIIMNFKIETPINFENLMMMSLMMKMGMIPFHLWILSFMEKLTWMKCLLMNTIQKLSPIVIISQMINFKTTILPMVLSLFMAPISMIKVNSIKKMMTYSSIYNSPWMISSIYISKNVFMLFFLIYSTMNFLFSKKMNEQNIMFFNQITEKTSSSKINLMINLISMSGMPPTMGFFPKWIILSKMNEISILISIMMLFSTIISSFIYLKILSSILLNQSTKKKFFKSMNFNETELVMNLMGTINFILFKPN